MTIGIPGYLTGANSFGVGISYLEFVKDYLYCSDLRILLPDSPLFTDIDILLLTGGLDVNPERYGEIPSYRTDKPDPIKEYFDVHVLPLYIEQRTKILGICRGCQSLAVTFGESLYQSMWHETNKQEDPYSGVHYLHVFSEPNKKIKVNSRHHQSIRVPVNKDSRVEVLATHKDFRNHIEVIKIKDYPAYGLQYHPEDLSENSGMTYTESIIKRLINEK